MPRKPRFAPPGYYLHLTQRGNYGQRTFLSQQDHLVFLNLLGQQAESHQIDILAFCLMPNHFHILARCNAPLAISRFMQGLNGQYAQYIHGRLTRRGRFWQDRFFSCVLQHGHLLAALRYVELNPVRANLVNTASDYLWSSAPIHANKIATPGWLDLETFQLLVTPSDWPAILAEGQSRQERTQVRGAIRSQRSIGQPHTAAAAT